MVNRTVNGQSIFVPNGTHWNTRGKPNPRCCDNCGKADTSHHVREVEENGTVTTASPGGNFGYVAIKKRASYLFCH